MQWIFGKLLQGTFYSFLTWMEPLGKSKEKTDISIEECLGPPGMVALRSYLHWYLEADQTGFSGMWRAAFSAGWHKSIPKTLLPPGLWRWLWIPRRGCLSDRDIWVEFSFRYNNSSKQYHHILGNVLAANNTTDSVDSSWLMLSNTETLQIHSGIVWLCLSECLELWYGMLATNNALIC